jgi:hypothetical protein
MTVLSAHYSHLNKKFHLSIFYTDSPGLKVTRTLHPEMRSQMLTQNDQKSSQGFWSGTVRDHCILLQNPNAEYDALK